MSVERPAADFNPPGTPPSLSRRTIKPIPVGFFLAAMVLVATNLRAPLTAVPPLIPDLRDIFSLSAGAAGVLTTLPVLCMGLFAPVATWLSRQYERTAVIGGATTLILLGQLIRIIGPMPFLYAGTLIVGIGIAIVGALLPGTIKAIFPEKSGLGTGLYMGGMMGLGTVAAALSVPIAHESESWALALSIWAIAAVLAVLCWIPIARWQVHERGFRIQRPAGLPAKKGLGFPIRVKFAWIISLFLITNSVIFYTLLTWLPAFFVSTGSTADEGGLWLSYFAIVQFVSGLAGPVFADRFRDRRWYYTGFVLCAVVGLLMLTFASGVSPFITIFFLGMGLGATFSLGLLLLVEHAATPRASEALSGMAFLLAYGCAAFFPALMGMVLDLTSNFTIVYGIMLISALIQLSIVYQLRPGRLVPEM